MAGKRRVQSCLTRRAMLLARPCLSQAAKPPQGIPAPQRVRERISHVPSVRLILRDLFAMPLRARPAGRDETAVEVLEVILYGSFSIKVDRRLRSFSRAIRSRCSVLSRRPYSSWLNQVENLVLQNSARSAHARHVQAQQQQKSGRRAYMPPRKEAPHTGCRSYLRIRLFLRSWCNS